jgi:hypothetical protein
MNARNSSTVRGALDATAGATTAGVASGVGDGVTDGVGLRVGVGVAVGLTVGVGAGALTLRSRCCCVLPLCTLLLCALAGMIALKLRESSRSSVMNLGACWFLMFISNEARLDFQGETRRETTKDKRDDNELKMVCLSFIAAAFIFYSLCYSERAYQFQINSVQY